MGIKDVFAWRLNCVHGARRPALQRYAWNRLRLEALEDRTVPAGIYGDFNGDGFADLAIGSPGETVNGMVRAGAVNVIYGSANGIQSSGGQLLTQNSAPAANFPIRAKADSQFGYAVTVGDFNGDGYDDLAVGVPFATIGSLTEAGLVCVFYGSANGLRTNNAQQWQQDTPGIVHRSAKFDWFGFSLAAGDFNNDGRDDLAIGSPGNSPGNPDVKRAGTVFVIYGTGSGLNAANNQSWDRNMPGVRGTDQVEAHYGWSVAAGDFNGDGYADLAAGIPHTDGFSVDTGAVSILFGSAARLTSNGSMLLAGKQSGVPNGQGIGDLGAANDRFGTSLAAADFNGDGRIDLAIGSPGKTVNGSAGAGTVTVILGGTAAGLNLGAVQVWSAANSGVPGGAQAQANFGHTLAAGRFNGDGRADLAIGIPNQNLGSLVNAGAVSVLHGSSTAGLGNGTSQFWTQAALGTSGSNQANARFGASLTAGSFKGNGRSDLVIAAPGRNVGGQANAGAINVLYSATSGLSGAGFHWLTQNHLGLDPAQAGDLFGAALASGW